LGDGAAAARCVLASCVLTSSALASAASRFGVPGSVLVGVLITSCTHLSPIEFEGVPRTTRVAVTDVREDAGWSKDVVSLGSVAAHCNGRAADGGWRGRRLSDVDCSAPRLRQALRERAAEVGGNRLVEVRCRARGAEADGSAAAPRSVWCEAFVGFAKDAPEPVAAVEPSRGVVHALESFRVKVDYSPERGVQPRAPRAPANVSELPHLSANRRALGEITTRCRNCSEAAAFEGLFAATAQVGGDSVVEPRCSARGKQLWCAATAAGFIEDPAVHADAR
jgi:hypothetical protein